MHGWQKNCSIGVMGDPHYPENGPPPDGGGGIVCKHCLANDEITMLVGFKSISDAHRTAVAIVESAVELWPDVCEPGTNVLQVATASGAGGQIEVVPASCDHCRGKEAYILRRVHPPALMFCLACTVASATRIAEAIVKGALLVPPSGK